MTDVNPLTSKEQEDYASISTHFRPNALRSTKMEPVNDPVTGDWVNPLQPELIDKLNGSFDTFSHPYTGSEAMTTIAYRAYETTSLWWVILYVNGFMHPEEIPSGYALIIPTRQSMDEMLADIQETKNGQTIVT